MPDQADDMPGKSDKKAPKVSVCIITYNQERYIGQCLKSILDQETDFDFEVIVGDDFSTDGTRVTVEAFSRNYPSIVKPIFHQKNIGGVENLLSVYRAAKGKYICHMDGDDYACPGKLQRQHDVLENNPGCTICSHDMLIVDKDGRLVRSNFAKHRAGVNKLMDLYEHLPFFAHSSKMFINDLHEKYWQNLHAKALDIEIHVQQAKKGDIFHIDQTLGAYREFVGTSYLEKKINPIIFDAVARVFEDAIINNFANPEVLKRIYAKQIFSYARQSAILGDSSGFKRYSRISFKISRISILQYLFVAFSWFPWFPVSFYRNRAAARPLNSTIEPTE